MADWDITQPVPVDVLQGASLMVRQVAINQVGDFDPDYFMYTEEVDLCYRLNIAGWSLFWVPASRITHFGGQSTRQAASDMFIRLYQSKLIFFRKRYGRASALGYKTILALSAVSRLAASPFAWIIVPNNRKKTASIARNYRRLLVELPGL